MICDKCKKSTRDPVLFLPVKCNCELEKDVVSEKPIDDSAGE